MNSCESSNSGAIEGWTGSASMCRTGWRKISPRRCAIASIPLLWGRRPRTAATQSGIGMRCTQSTVNGGSCSTATIRPNTPLVSLGPHSPRVFSNMPGKTSWEPCSISRCPRRTGIARSTALRLVGRTISQWRPEPRPHGFWVTTMCPEPPRDWACPLAQASIRG